MKSLILILLLIFTGCGNSDPEKRGLNILVLGQSNIANYGATYEPLNYKASSTYIMCEDEAIEYESPIQCDNSTGNYSTMLPLLGDMIVQSTNYEYIEVIFNNIAIGGSSVASWANNDLHRINALKNYDLILWHQGETDTIYNTTKEEYISSFLQLRQNIRDLNITAPILIARASYNHGNTSQHVIDAQNFLIDTYDDILEGANTDTLGSEYRYDDLHFNKYGLRLHAEMWLDYIIMYIKD